MAPSLPTRWLSCHVDYACRHSGACCRSGWPLPVETRAAPAIAHAVDVHRLVTVDRSPVWLIESVDAPPDVAGTFRLVDGACVFHQARDGAPAVSVSSSVPNGALVSTATTSGRHCAVHAALGHAALPASCQHFPRVCLIDDAEVRVTLSHFCPTAATMLVDYHDPVTVVDGPPPVPDVSTPEGFDVRGQLPPALSVRVLTDRDGFTRWEAHVVDVLAGPSSTPEAPEAVLAWLAASAQQLAAWRPGRASFAEAVAVIAATPSARALASHQPLDGAATEFWTSTTGAQRLVRFEMVRHSCRVPWTWEPAPDDVVHADAAWVAPTWLDVSPVVRRYLAAKAFASCPAM
jgi:hypothetical protein